MYTQVKKSYVCPNFCLFLATSIKVDATHHRLPIISEPFDKDREISITNRRVRYSLPTLALKKGKKLGKIEGTKCCVNLDASC